MSEDKESGINPLIMPVVVSAALSGLGTTGIHSVVNSDSESVVNSVTIQQCQPFIEHARGHAIMEKELEHLRELIKKR